VNELRIAVLIPCRNEEITIAKTVSGFRNALGEAKIYVYDNNSSDRTIDVAQLSGATVRRECLQGKGQVVRRMFADVEADIYVLVDGDGTYDANSAPAMIRLLLDEGLDMVTGVRIDQEGVAYRRGHRLGNRALTSLVSSVFGKRVSDMLSGYRVMSRRLIKSFPAMSSGFETETELTVHALELRMPIADYETAYFARPEGSKSKLSTYRDGLRILHLLVTLIKDERPLPFFGALSAILLLSGLLIGIPVVYGFVQTGLVLKLPSAVLATGLVLLSFLAMSSGIILHSVGLSRRELRRIAYLGLSGPHALMERLTSVAGSFGNGAGRVDPTAARDGPSPQTALQLRQLLPEESVWRREDVRLGRIEN
jgi:glycosyltransferase involved in cell wall biosynthesis